MEYIKLQMPTYFVILVSVQSIAVADRTLTPQLQQQAWWPAASFPWEQELVPMAMPMSVEEWTTLAIFCVEPVDRAA